MPAKTLQAVTGSSAAILDELESLQPEWAPLPVVAETAEQPIVIPGTGPVEVTRPVLVAVDDDDNAGALLRHGSAIAEQLGVPLRAAYVWADCRSSDCAHHRHCHRDLGEASRLLTML